jgi:hypothetical protein
MEATNESRQQVDEYYRRVMDGHVYIRESIDTLLDMLGARIRRIQRRPRILELGCHAGVSTRWILERWPEVEVVVQDTREDLLPIDVVVSIARHHHLSHDYLSTVRRGLESGGVYLLAEELCPEYCTAEHAARIGRAEALHIAGGWVFTSQAEIESYRAHGTVPPHVRDLERLRRRALWRWYRFVVDRAVDRGYYDIAAAELQSARDDLVTGSDAEHKLSPLIVERQFALAGFELLSKRYVRPTEAPERQSMIVYEYALP